MIPNASHAADDRPTLSVVIVAENEEPHIRACIESVLAASRDLLDTEVILVDSNSTDRTVDIAAEYPITILRIPEELTSPAAGRYVGTQAASGEVLLFVDGDMVVQRPWLHRALEVLETEEMTAAVDGHLDGPATTNHVTDVDAVRGVALYEAAPLRSVGGFDPHLEGLEDVHLGLQLGVAGYDLRRLPEVAATHNSNPSLGDPIRRLRQGYFYGAGQVLRRSVDSPAVLTAHLSRMRYRFTLFVWLALGLVVALSPPLRLLWLGLTVVAGAVLVSKLGVEAGARFLLTKTLGMFGVLRGLALPARPPESFPLSAVETLQLGTVHRERAPEIVE